MKSLVLILLLAAGTTLLTVEAASAKAKSVSGTYSCDCFSGNTVVSGSCSVSVRTDGSAECGKHSGDTCTATCKMVTFQQGAGGGSIAISPGAKGAIVKGGARLQKAQ